MIWPTLLLTAVLVDAEDAEHQWARWRGPLATGVAPHATPPLKWSEDENVQWKVELPGHGKSTPIIWADQVFVLNAEPTGSQASAEVLGARHEWDDALTENPTQLWSFVVSSFDRETGDRLWETELARTLPVEGVHPTNGYASSSPVTDGKRLYSYFGSHGLFCTDLEGELLWTKSLPPMHTRKGWGEGATPALAGDVLVVPFDHEGESFVVVLDAITGDERWRKARDEPTTWATPLVVEHDGQLQVILQGTTRVRSYDLGTGEVLWECGGQTVNAIPTPVTANGLVYCLSGYRGQAAYALPLDQRGDLTDSDHVRWHLHRGTPYIPSPVLAEGRLWFSSNQTAMLTCVDAATGETLVDRARLPQLGRLYSSPLIAAGRLYITDRDGLTLVLTADPGLEVLAANQLDSPIDASPAAVGNQLFLRGEQALYCLSEQ